jgi:gluconolactonase
MRSHFPFPVPTFAIPALLIAALGLPVLAQPAAGISGVVAAGVQPQLVQEGFVFTDGPVGSFDGGLYFSDVRANKIYFLNPSGKITSVRDNTAGANGLAFNSGELYAAEGTGKLISRGNSNGRSVPVIENDARTMLNAPNDLIFDTRGGIYFTDPSGGPLFPKVAGRAGKVYYASTSAGAPPYPIDDKITLPNGIALAIDYRTLYVDDTLGESIWAFDLLPNAAVKSKHVFAKIPQLTDGESLADGMCIDRDNRLYVTTGAGVQVFDKKGKFLGNIKLPRQPSNCAFSGPDKKTLYITAREGLYSLKVQTPGPLRMGK